jgi:hypothetical protein
MRGSGRAWGWQRGARAEAAGARGRTRSCAGAPAHWTAAPRRRRCGPAGCARSPRSWSLCRWPGCSPRRRAGSARPRAGSGLPHILRRPRRRCSASRWTRAHHPRGRAGRERAAWRVWRVRAGVQCVEGTWRQLAGEPREQSTATSCPPANSPFPALPAASCQRVPGLIALGSSRQTKAQASRGIHLGDAAIATAGPAEATLLARAWPTGPPATAKLPQLCYCIVSTNERQRRQPGEAATRAEHQRGRLGPRGLWQDQPGCAARGPRPADQQPEIQCHWMGAAAWACFPRAVPLRPQWLRCPRACPRRRWTSTRRARSGASRWTWASPPSA